MRVQSGITDQYIYFCAVDSTDLKTRKTGLTSFTVYRARNGGAATAYTTPTIAEVSSANMPGVYSLLLDEDMTIDAGDDSQAVVLHITQASMAPVTLMYELYRPIVTAGSTITVANGCADADIERIQGTVVSTPATAGILDVNTKNINNTAAATPGASGGLLISGSNSGTTTLGALTVTGSLTISDGLLVSRSTSNASAATFTGNGTGSGIVATSGSGATGDGIQATAASTNGNGLKATGTGTGAGQLATGGATGNGVKYVGGGTSGDALLTSATSGHGATFAGAGTTKHGINATGGTTTSAGIAATGGATSGDGILISATSGHGISTSGGGTTKHGISATGGATSSDGIRATGGGTGHGINAQGGSGATGNGINAVSNATNGSGITLTKTGTGNDFNATSTPLTLAKTTNITGFNDITAADVWAAGTRTLTAGTNINGSTFTAIPWNAAWDAEVQSEVEDALVVHRLDELLNADSDIDGAAPPTVGSVFHELMTKTTGSFTYDQTTDSLEAVRDRGDAAWITATGFSTHSAADVWAVGTRVLTAATNISGPIADQVWEEAIADHSGTAGSTAEALAAAGSAGDPWSTALPGAYGAGTAGKIVGDNLNATVSSRLASASYTAPLDAAGTRSAVGLASANLDTQLAAIDTETDKIASIKTKTDQLTFTVANQVDANAESMNATAINGTGTSGDLWRGA